MFSSSTFNLGPSPNAFDVPLTDTVAVRSGGLLLLIARAACQENTTLYFNVSKPTLSPDAELGNWSGWYRFYFPDHQNVLPDNERYTAGLPPPELRVAGMDLITVTPAAHRASPADAPFRVIAVDQTLYCFRPSKDGTLYLNRLTILEKNASDSDDDEQAPGREGGGSTYELEQMWEARFRASGLKDSPASDRDSQSVFSPGGQPFLEPTIELTADVAIGEGGFDVVGVPTVDPKITQIYIASTGREKNGTREVVKIWILTISDGGQFDLSELGSNIEIVPALKTGENEQQALQPLTGLAPALAFYYEQDSPVTTAAATPSGDESSLQDARLAVAVPVGNDAIGLSRAVAIYDFGIKENGKIPNSFDSPAILVDGTLSDGSFHKKTATGFPTPDQALQTVHIVDGLTVTAMVLGQVQPQRSPLFLTGSDGLLHLYFAGPNAVTSPDGNWGGLVPGEPTFQVAQYNSRSQRSVIDLTWFDAARSEAPGGTVRLLARRAGPTMNNTAVSVAPFTASGGPDDTASHPDLCTVTIDYGGTAVDLPTEVWQGVPRDLRNFIRVINGETIELASDPRAKLGRSTFFDPSGLFFQVRIATNVSLSGDNPGANGQPPFPAVLTLVSSRLDLRLQSATVSDHGSPDTATLVLRVGSNEGGCDITYKGISRQIKNIPDILNGSDPRYAYGTLTPLLSLTTESDDGQDAIIFYPTPAREPDLSNVTISVIPNEGDPNKCDVQIKQGEINLNLSAISRAQTDFITAIKQHQDWNQFQLAISPGPLPGDVVDQTVSKPNNLAGASILFDALLPAEGLDAKIKNGVYGALVQQRLPIAARSERGMLGLYALLGTLPESGGDQYLQFTTAGPVRPTIDGQSAVWQTRQQTYDLTFDGASRMNVPIVGQGQPLASRANLAPDMDWTFEAWLRPTISNTRALATYHASSPDAVHGEPTADYVLGTTGSKSLQFAAVKSSPPVRKSTYLTTGTDRSLLLDTSFTWEFWVQPDAVPAPSPTGALGYALMVAELQNPNPNFAVGLNRDRKVVVRYTRVGQQPQNVTSQGTITFTDSNGDSVWTHIAVVVERAPAGGPTEGKATISIVINGALDSSAEADLGRFTTLPRANIGGVGLNDASLAGRLGSMRFWTTTRSIQQIRSTAFRSLGGNEHGLAGLWALEAEVTKGGEVMFENRAESTGDHLNAILIPSGNQDWATVPNRFLLGLVAGVAGAPVESGSAVLRTNRWNHVAVVYRAGGGLRLRGRSASAGTTAYDYAYEENTTTFGFTDRCAFDAWIQLSAASKGAANSIIGRWSSEESGREFELFVDDSGAFAARFVVKKNLEGDTIDVEASGGANLLAADAGGLFPVCHVAAKLVLTNTVSEDNQTTTGVYYLELRIDNQQVAVVSNNATPIAGRTVRLQMRTSETTLTVGMRSLPKQPWESLDVGDHAFFRGVIGETRVWSSDPTWPQVFPERFPDRLPEIAPPGLVARWAFREQSGVTAYDLIRDDNLRLSSADLWTQVKATSVQELYANGGRIWDTKPNDSLTYSSQDQFTLGQRLEGGDGFVGDMTQVRVWREARTADQILENLYCQLKGNEPNLTAFWNFDAGADKKPNAQDRTGGGNNANPEPDQSRFLISDAPVSNEGPEVFNTYGGVVTDFQVTTKIRPAVAELVTASRNRDGVATGKMVRQYVFEDPVASLPAPFKVGDLELNFIGQVQTNAKLIGYIEGAPPVPSENLTLPYFDSVTGFLRYDGSSQVTLTQTGETSISYSNGRQTTSDISVKGSAGPFWKFENGVAYGIGVSFVTQAFSVEGQFVATTSHDFKWGSGVDNTYSSAWTNRATDWLQVSGKWEASDSVLNPTVGRRYQLNNLGTALVESLVADSFAIRDARTGAMLGVMLIPNLAIPPDRNIVTFPLRDKYTKQGTLDGKVGFVDDPSYLGDLGRGSYFKPAEAYALKSQIEQSAARDQAFYRQFDAQGRGQTEFTADLSGVTKNLPVDFEADTVRRGLVNSYVWSADGGHHAEEQSYLARVSHSYRGFFQRANRAGFDLESTFVFFVGMRGALSFSGGLQLDVNVGSTDQKSLSFGLSSVVEGERYLHAWQPAIEPAKGHYSPEPAPGKVRAYRFMTFYLPPSETSAQGFASVVDPIWIRRSTDAAAVVLRSADTSNPAWRILHRVTYVERVPPGASDEPVTSRSSPAPTPVNLKGNIALIALVTAELGTASPTPAEIGRALQRVLNPAPDAGGSYPKATIENALPWWGAFLEKARPGQQHQPDAAALLSRIFTDVLTYVKNGYASGAISTPILLTFPAKGGSLLKSQGHG